MILDNDDDSYSDSEKNQLQKKSEPKVQNLQSKQNLDAKEFLTIDDLDKFQCPINENHILLKYEELKKHIYTCKQLKGKTIYVCRYVFAHLFMSKNIRDDHEKTCRFKDPNKQYNPQPDIIIQQPYNPKPQKKLSQSQINYNINWYSRNSERLKEEKRIRDEKRQRLLEIQEENKKIEQEFEEKYKNEQQKLQLNQNNDFSSQQQFDIVAPKMQPFKMVLSQRGQFPLRHYYIGIDEFKSIQSIPPLMAEIHNLGVQECFKRLRIAEFNLIPYQKVQDFENLEKNIADDVVGHSFRQSADQQFKEILIIISKQTQYFGNLMNEKSKLAALLISNQGTINNSINSYWLKTQNDEQQMTSEEQEIIEKKRKQQQQETIMQIELTDIIKKASHQYTEDKKKFQQLEEDMQYRLNTEKQEITSKTQEEQRIQKQYSLKEHQIKELEESQKIMKEKIKSEYNQEIEKMKEILNKKFEDFQTMYYDEQEDYLDKPIILEQQTQRFINDILSLELENRQEEQATNELKQESLIQQQQNENLQLKLNKLKNTHKSESIILQIQQFQKEAQNILFFETACLICFEQGRQIVNFPCGHITHCYKCHKYSGFKLLKQCILCQRNVDRVIQTVNYEIQQTQNTNINE